MKKIYMFLISLLLFIPFVVKAETLTYNVCKSGCEYNISSFINKITNDYENNYLTNNDIIINLGENEVYEEILGNIELFNSEYPQGYYDNSKDLKSITINGNNSQVRDFSMTVGTKRMVVNDLNVLATLDNVPMQTDIFQTSNRFTVYDGNLTVNNSKIPWVENRGRHTDDLVTLTVNDSKINFFTSVGHLIVNNSDMGYTHLSHDHSQIYNISYNNSSLLGYLVMSYSIYNTNFVCENSTFVHDLTINSSEVNITNCNLQSLLVSDISMEVRNSKLKKIVNGNINKNSTINIYNSTFNSLRYNNQNISMDELIEWENLEDSYDSLYFAPDFEKIDYDIYDMSIDNYSHGISNTTVYFDKEATVKVGNKLNLVNYLDYYTEDKEIEYTIEDESIAKIENKELIGLKEGSTKVTVTTDDGHIVYRINLIVEKESVPEKIDKMTIKVPITGSKLKLWVLIVGGILLGIALICVYMLIKRKK